MRSSIAMAKDIPFEKLTPEACKIAFPSKLSAPEASLCDVMSASDGGGHEPDDIHNL